MCAKYDGSRMNNACTVCPADFVSLPAKVVWLDIVRLCVQNMMVLG